uniref:Uncharacterized protein n=1 Tax=Brassica oleracea var. oleracea TaxID=109376 RepID=A0A0D3CHT1_BRAOL
MTSRKRSSKKKTSPQSSSGNPCTNEEIVPNEEFEGESVEDPLEGFFTCYEAFLTRCRMWFLIPEAIVRALDRFELSISQLNVAALQKFLGGIALEDKNFVSEDLPLPGWNPGFTPGDGSGTSEAPLPDDFFANLPPGFITPASLDEASRREVVAEGSRLINEEMLVFNSTFDGSFREARLSHFKAEEIERKFICFQKEVAERERRQAESHSRALIHVGRKGRRAIAAELARRATLFDAEFWSFKDAKDYVGDFRECRGSAESMVPPIEGRIRELWEPIEVSEDMTEAGADAADEGGEVDQPTDSFGASISGYLDLDL